MSFHSQYERIDNAASVKYLRYVNDHREQINAVSATLGIRGTALAGCMMEEYRAQHSRIISVFGTNWTDVTQEAGTLHYIGKHAGYPSSQAMLEALYEEHKETIESGKYTPRKLDASFDHGVHATNPMGLDIGVGNIKFGYAIDLLKKYIADHPNDDPLKLKRYEKNYEGLFRDISNPDGYAAIAMCGLAVKEAEDFLNNHPDARVRERYRNATPEQQDQYIDVRYRYSPDKATEIMQTGKVEEALKRNGVPDFYTGSSWMHPNTYKYYGEILDGSLEVRGQFFFTGNRREQVAQATKNFAYAESHAADGFESGVSAHTQPQKSKGAAKVPSFG